MCLVSQSCRTVCNPMDCSPPGSSVHGDSPDKSTGVDCHALLQGIFPIQGSNPGLSYCRWILYCLNHQGSPRILEWVAYPFSRGSSQPRDQTQVFSSLKITTKAHIQSSHENIKFWKPQKKKKKHIQQKSSYDYSLKLSLDSLNSYKGKIRIDYTSPNGRQLVLTSGPGVGEGRKEVGCGEHWRFMWLYNGMKIAGSMLESSQLLPFFHTHT